MKVRGEYSFLWSSDQFDLSAWLPIHSINWQKHKSQNQTTACLALGYLVQPPTISERHSF
jgi:hypothetical protein